MTHIWLLNSDESYYGDWPSLVAQLVKNPAAIWETWVQSLGWEDPWEKRKATYSSILAWRIPWTVQSIGLQKVRHDWVTFTRSHRDQLLYRYLVAWGAAYAKIMSSSIVSCLSFPWTHSYTSRSLASKGGTYFSLQWNESSQAIKYPSKSVILFIFYLIELRITEFPCKPGIEHNGASVSMDLEHPL